MSSRKCPYKYCAVPENNTVFLFEAIYMLVASIALINFPGTMTTFSVILLLFPAILELGFAKSKNIVISIVIWIFRLADGFVIILCFLALASIIEYRGTEFFVPSSAIFLPEACLLPKKVFAGILIANLIPPLTYYFGNPCQKRMEQAPD